MVALGRLRKLLRDDPNARNCHICAWTATPRRALYVMSGAHGQWYDCGEHPDEPNGKPLFKEDIGEWMLKHGLVEGKREPEVPDDIEERTPDGALGNVTPRMRRVLEQLARGAFDIDSYHAVRPLIENALGALIGLDLIDFVDGKYAINARGHEELEDRGAPEVPDIDPGPRSGPPTSKVWADKFLEHGGLADEPLKVSLHSAGGEEVGYNGYERATTKLVYKAGAGLVSEQFSFPTAKTRAAFPAKMLSVWSIAGEMLFGVEMVEETTIEAGETPTFEAGAIKVSLS